MGGAPLIRAVAGHYLTNHDISILSVAICRYGVTLGLLSPSTISTHLPSLMSLLTHHKLHPPPQDSSPLHLGFNWLCGLVFLLMRGDEDTSVQLLSHLHWLMVTSYVSSTVSVY